MKKRVNISIDDKTLYILDNLAEVRGIDRSTMITLAVRYLDKNSGSDFAEDYEVYIKSYHLY